MGYAGYVPAKIAQFEFTPLEQARAGALTPARFQASRRAAAAPRALGARSGAPRPAARYSLPRPMRRAVRGLTPRYRRRRSRRCPLAALPRWRCSRRRARLLLPARSAAHRTRHAGAARLRGCGVAWPRGARNQWSPRCHRWSAPSHPRQRLRRPRSPRRPAMHHVHACRPAGHPAPRRTSDPSDGPRASLAPQVTQNVAQQPADPKFRRVPSLTP